MAVGAVLRPPSRLTPHVAHSRSLNCWVERAAPLKPVLMERRWARACIRGMPPVLSGAGSSMRAVLSAAFTAVGAAGIRARAANDNNRESECLTVRIMGVLRVVVGFVPVAVCYELQARFQFRKRARSGTPLQKNVQISLVGERSSMVSSAATAYSPVIPMRGASWGRFSTASQGRT